MDRARFYAALRRRASGVFGTSLSQGQVEGVEALLNEAVKRRVPLRHVAYILATAYHETAHTMRPIAEYGKGKGRTYGLPDGPYAKTYYGRGYVQLTWLANYEKAGKALGVDLVKHPERAMEKNIAAAILFEGMEQGWFTGKKLSDYINGATDYVNARRIVNGTDRASMLAGYASAFEKALQEAGYSAPQKPVLPPKPSPRPDTPKTPKRPPAPKHGRKRIVPAIIAAVIAALAAAAAYLFGG